MPIPLGNDNFKNLTKTKHIVAVNMIGKIDEVNLFSEPIKKTVAYKNAVVANMKPTTTKPKKYNKHKRLIVENNFQLTVSFSETSTDFAAVFDL